MIKRNKLPVSFYCLYSCFKKYNLNLVVLLGFNFLCKSAWSQNEWYQPIIFDSGYVLVYQPDMRLNLGIEGTIELQLALPKKFPDTAAIYSIIKNGQGSNEQFKIAISGNKKYIVFSNGLQSARWNYNFRDTLFHQVAFTTSIGRTACFVDGVKCSLNPQQSKSSKTRAKTFQSTDSSALICYNPKIDFDQELKIGNDEDEAVSFKLRTLRIWNRKLNVADLNNAADNYGAPVVGTADDITFSGLVAYTFFTTVSNEFFYTIPDIFTTEYAGITAGNYSCFPNELRVQPGSWALASLLVQKDSLDNVKLMPVIARRNNGVLSDSSLAYIQVISRSSVNSYGLDTAAFPLLTRTLGYFNQNFPSLNTDIRAIDLRNKKAIKRLYGTHNGAQIVSLYFQTDNNEQITIVRTSVKGPLESFCVDIPAHSNFAGVLTRQDTLGLKAIATLYSFDFKSQDDFTVLNRIYSSGRWLDPDESAISRLYNSTDKNIHGNYSTAPVYSIKELAKDSVYMVFRDMGADSMISYFQFSKTKYSNFEKAVTEDSVWKPLYLRANQWQCIPGKASIMYTKNGIYLKGSSEFTKNFPPDLARPSAYSLPFPDKLAWGGTFSQEHRPAMSKGNFVGYDIFKMDPMDFQKDVYAKKEIFEYPGESSYNYYTTDNRILVPYGLLYRNDNIGTEKSKTTTYHDAEGYTSAWGMHVGVNAGIEGVASFSENVEYQQEVSELDQQGFSKTVAKSIIGKYALVLDKSKMELSDDFIAAVNNLRNDFINGIYPDYYGFMEAFGTHYPYSVTYGGMAYLVITDSTTDKSVENSNSIAIEASADADIEGITFGASAGYSQSFKENKDIQNSKQSIRFETIGGSMSRGEGWSLARGEEVPILMDLRPITEIFSPTFFDDPVIWTDLRMGLLDAIKIRGHHSMQPISCPSWTLNLEFDNSCENYEFTLSYNLNGSLNTFTLNKNDTTFVIPEGATDLNIASNSYHYGWPNPIVYTGCPEELTVTVTLYGNRTKTTKGISKK